MSPPGDAPRTARCRRRRIPSSRSMQERGMTGRYRPRAPAASCSSCALNAKGGLSGAIKQSISKSAEIGSKNLAFDHGKRWVIFCTAASLSARPVFQALAGTSTAMEGAAQSAAGRLNADRRRDARNGARSVRNVLLVAKQHQIFAKHFDGFHRARPWLVDQRRHAGIRINFPHASARPVRVIRSFCSLAHHGGGPFWRGSEPR